MGKTAAAGSVLLFVAFLSGCGTKDPAEPSFRRAGLPPTPVPAADPRQGVPGVVRTPAAASTPAGQTEPLHVGGNVVAPVEIVRVTPDCRALVGAVFPVAVELVVTREGTVSGARVLSTAPENARGLVLQSVHGWRFRPATLDGRPVSVYFDVALSCP